MVRVFYSPACAGSGHAFDTTRKATWIADSLAESAISGIELLEPAPLTRVQLAQSTTSTTSTPSKRGFRGSWPNPRASRGM